MPPLSRDRRICIIGAGAAGISAARSLRRRGYERIILLEKAGRPGGKCWSFMHDGKPLELGACAVAPDHTHVLNLAAEVGAAIRPVEDFVAVEQTSRIGSGVRYKKLAGHTFSKHGIGEVLLAGWNYLAAQRRHSRVLRRPGYAGMSLRGPDRDLSAVFAEWAGRGGMKPLLTLMLMPFSAWGYGDIGSIPAAYILRYISSRIYLGLTLAPVLNRIGMHWPRKFDRGFGDLFERAAMGLDIRLNARIEKITRENGVSVEWTQTQNGAPVRCEDRFDVLIVACPPRATKDFLSWSAEEARLFERIRTQPYSVTICETEGVPASVTFCDPQPAPGRLIQLWKPQTGPGGCIFYTYRPVPPLSPEQIYENIRQDLRHFYPKAVLGRVLKHVDWDYFPHVDAEAFAAGYYDDFEAMQGSEATWYCGSLLGFESVEGTMAYSESLVERLTRGLG